MPAALAVVLLAASPVGGGEAEPVPPDPAFIEFLGELESAEGWQGFFDDAMRAGAAQARPAEERDED